MLFFLDKETAINALLQLSRPIHIIHLKSKCVIFKEAGINDDDIPFVMWRKANDSVENSSLLMRVATVNDTKQNLGSRQPSEFYNWMNNSAHKQVEANILAKKVKRISLKRQNRFNQKLTSQKKLSIQFSPGTSLHRVVLAANAKDSRTKIIKQRRQIITVLKKATPET